MTEAGEQQAPLPTLAQTDQPDVAVIPGSVINSPKLSLADLGLYVKLTHLMDLYTGPSLDQMVGELLRGAFGQRVDVDEQVIRAGVQRLIDAGHLELQEPPRPRRQWSETELGPF